MKKIGFIDYYLDEWHANTYPKMIEDATNGEMKICYAFAEIESPHENSISNSAWAEKYNVELLESIEELVNKSDYIIVLSPDNPEMHEKLSQIPLTSGKPVYIDKTFAPDKETAKRLFTLADKYNTPCFTSSALNYATEYEEVDEDDIQTINSWGPGVFEIYSIHQIEPVVKLMGTNAKRVMSLGSDTFPSIIIDYDNGRYAQIANFPKGTPFAMNIGFTDGSTKQIKVESQFFKNFIEKLVIFFKTKVIPVPHEQSIAVMSIREAALKAIQQPFTWINL